MLYNTVKFIAAGAVVVGVIAAIDAVIEANEAAKKAAKEKADAELRRVERAIDAEYKQTQEEFAKAREELAPTTSSFNEGYVNACLRQYGMSFSMLQASPQNEILLGLAA